MSFAAQAVSHAREVRQRLRNPQNAVPDKGIDLKRKVIPIAAIVGAEVVSKPEPLDVFGPRILSVDDIAFGPIVGKPEAVGPKPPMVDDIVRAVARHFNVTRGEILSSRRTAGVVLPRQIAAYLSKALTLRSFPEIGRIMGGRDHTTIMHSVRKIEALRLRDELVEQSLQALTMALVGCPLRPASEPQEATDATPQHTAD